MKLIGLMLVRSEDWILEASLDAARRWVDDVVVTLHNCTDNSLNIASRIGFDRGSIHADVLDSVSWDEMHVRQQQLEAARFLGATHIAIIDADEILTANLLPNIRGEFEKLRPAECLEVPMLAMRALAQYQDDDSVWARAWLTLGFADAPELTWKPAGDGYQHHHRAPYGIVGTRRYLGDKSQGGAMHLQFANKRRLLAKHVLYRMVDFLRWPGRETIPQLNIKYDAALEAPKHLGYAPESWWAGYNKGAIRLDGVPWQEAEIARLVKEHGREKFAGLDLKGLA